MCLLSFFFYYFMHEQILYFSITTSSHSLLFLFCIYFRAPLSLVLFALIFPCRSSSLSFVISNYYYISISLTFFPLISIIAFYNFCPKPSLSILCSLTVCMFCFKASTSLNFNSILLPKSTLMFLMSSSCIISYSFLFSMQL